MRGSRIGAIALGLVLVMAVAGACSKTLDTGGLESEIVTQLEEQTGQGGWTVDCPEDIKVETGATFDCEATAEGTTLPLTVTQEDDQGNVTWKLQGSETSP